MLGQKNTTKISLEGSNRVQTLLGLLFVLIAVGVYVFATRSVSADLKTIDEEVVLKESNVETLKTQIEQYQASEKKLNVSDEKKRQILQSIPIGVNQDDVIRDIVDIATLNEIELQSIGFSKSAAVNDVGILKINASFEGNYEDLITFLEAIEENGRKFQVSSISVQINALEKTEFKKATFSLTIDSFFQGEEI